MKKAIFLFFLLIPFIQQAQEFNAGLMAGIAPSQLDGDKFSGYNKLGYTAGGYVNGILPNTPACNSASGLLKRAVANRTKRKTFFTVAFCDMPKCRLPTL
jgi:hypothetical protein